MFSDFADQPTRGQPDQERGAWIALGSNLGDSRAIVLAAMDRLESFSETPPLRSSLWESEPIDCPPGSPAFINAVLGLRPRAGETPETLHARLQALETEFGRRPKRIVNESRPLDLDLLGFGRCTLQTSALTLPHPRAHLRRFVLAPLAEIAPDLVLPGWGGSAKTLLEALGTAQPIRRLPGPAESRCT